tara:strand:- start:348 stop:572 length:225 start_codon:yes stop_codon:yes gene_type:complete
MENKNRIDHLKLVLSELIHSNVLSEKKLTLMNEHLSLTKSRVSSLEKVYVISTIVLSLVGGGVIFAVLKIYGLA